MVPELRSRFRPVTPFMMLLPRRFEKDRPEFFTGAAAGLDGVAVRAERDHLGWVVSTSEGQVTYVIDLQNRFALLRVVLDVAGASRVPATSSAAEKDSAPRGLRTDEIERGPLGSRASSRDHGLHRAVAATWPSSSESTCSNSIVPSVASLTMCPISCSRVPA